MIKKHHHIERFSSFVREELASFLRDELPHEEGVVVSLMRVDSAPSGGKVNAWVSVWPDDQCAQVAKQLQLLENKAKAYLAGRLNRKYAISVHFYVIVAT